MTDAEKVEVLQGAIERAGRVLDWILADPKSPEFLLTTATRVRKILDAGLRRAGITPAAAAAASGSPAGNAGPVKIKLPKVKLDIAAMKANGTLSERKQK